MLNSLRVDFISLRDLQCRGDGGGRKSDSRFYLLLHLTLLTYLVLKTGSVVLGVLLFWFPGRPNQRDQSSVCDRQKWRVSFLLSTSCPLQTTSPSTETRRHHTVYLFRFRDYVGTRLTLFVRVPRRGRHSGVLLLWK